ncbi:hypothetical protein LC605_13460 [Nostoc sp. CHAB 5836]|nr:hypothetical protein [Nostoc sp. CHAB 5836]
MPTKRTSFSSKEKTDRLDITIPHNVVYAKQKAIAHLESLRSPFYPLDISIN